MKYVKVCHTVVLASEVYSAQLVQTTEGKFKLIIHLKVGEERSVTWENPADATAALDALYKDLNREDQNMGEIAQDLHKIKMATA